MTNLVVRFLTNTNEEIDPSDSTDVAQKVQQVLTLL